MYRCAISAVRSIRQLTTVPYFNAAKIISNNTRSINTLQNVYKSNMRPIAVTSLVHNRQILDISNKIITVPARTVTKFSLNKGKRKTVKAAIKRFFRLHWGGWIRTKVGRKKKLWKKSLAQKRRLRQHVFCNSTQNTLLDKMVTKYWKRPRYYVDDPYTPYHTREEFRATRTKPVKHEHY